MAKQKKKTGTKPPTKKIKAETKSELQDYYRSNSGRSLGYSSKSKGADKVLRAMDIVGNKRRMTSEFEAGKKTGKPPKGVSQKVYQASLAVRKKKK